MPRSTAPGDAAPAPRMGLIMLSAGLVDKSVPPTLPPNHDDTLEVSFSPSHRSPFPSLFNIFGIDDENF